MRKLLIVVFVFIAVTVNAALRYWIGTGDGNWGSTNNWSATSGGATGASVPTNADDVNFDGAGNNNCTINTTNRACKSFTVTAGYTSTITFNVTLSVSGNTTHNTGVTYVNGGSGLLNINATGTHTSNTKTINIPITFTGNATHTLADNFTISGDLTLGTGTVLGTMNSNNIYATGNVTHGNSTGTFTGTTTLNLTGTGTLTSSSSSGSFRLNTVINTAGTITVSGNFCFANATLTYTAGTVVTAGSTLNCLSASAATTLNTSGIVWDAVSLGTQGPTFTLSSNIDCTDLSIVIGSTGVIINTGTINVSGDLTTTQGAGHLTGTGTINLTGTGTWSSTTTTGGIRINITVNTAGTITMTGTVNYNVGTFTHTAGTFNASGSVWAILNTTAPTFTINSTGLTLGDISPNTDISFGGTNGFTADAISITLAGVDVTFASGETYTFTSHWSVAGTAATHCIFKSSSTPTQAIVTLQAGATQDMSFVDGTDIDSSLGQTIWTYKGTLSNTINWALLTATGAQQRGYTW